VKAIALIFLLLMTSCAARHEPPQVQATNPYQVRAEGLARSGVDALGREQWKRAQILFDKSLQAATLADDKRLMSLAWYNLGRAREADGDAEKARAAFLQAIQQADQAQDAVSRQRADLALALLDAHDSAADKVAVSTDLLRVPDSFPVDVHLAAARLAYLEHQSELARHAYGRVLAMVGQDRSGLTYSARAYLGLTELAREQAAMDGVGEEAAWKHLHQALDLLHRSGEPRLMLKALHLAAEMEANPTRRQQWLQRAKAVQQALQKVHKE